MPTPTIFESIIANNFLKLPPWARIISYFIFLLVFLYQTLIPKFINGEIKEYTANDFEGEYVPYREARVSVKYDGKPIAAETANAGHWSLPFLYSPINHTDIDLSIEYRDPNGETLTRSLIVPWKTALTSNIVIGYNPHVTQKFKLLNGANTKNGAPNDTASTSVGFSLISTAYAQDNYKQQYEPVSKEVNDSIGKLRRSKSVGNLTYPEKKAIQADIEKKFNIQLDSNDIQQSKSAEDLTRNTVTKILSKSDTAQYAYAYYGNFDQSGNWAERFFNVKVGQDNTARAPQTGDIVESTGTVNIRAGYIDYNLIEGWVNQPVLGNIKPGEKFLIEEVKYIAGDYVWVKIHRID